MKKIGLKIYQLFKRIFYVLTGRYIERKVVGNKSIAQIVAWLETHGVDRSTAGHIMGFLKAYDIELGAIRLCNYGLTYSFEEFIQWWKSEESFSPVENKPAIFWNHGQHGGAFVGIFKEEYEREGQCEDVPCLYEANNGLMYDCAVRFDSMAVYRHIINTPDDCQVPEYLTGHLHIPEKPKKQKDEDVPTYDASKPVS